MRRRYSSVPSPFEDDTDGGYDDSDMFPLPEPEPVVVMPPPKSTLPSAAVGAAAGFLLLGPLGALLGAAGGYAHAKSKEPVPVLAYYRGWRR